MNVLFPLKTLNKQNGWFNLYQITYNDVCVYVCHALALPYTHIHIQPPWMLRAALVET